MYTGVLIFLWSQPTMTQGQMLLAIATTLYLLLVVPWLEEPDLIEQFGHKYLDYMNTTGMFFPCPLTHTKKLK
jgi:protein-S-isoprenylcysteine O-methyltransferase Ste14